jgi:hypothetical protein
MICKYSVLLLSPNVDLRSDEIVEKAIGRGKEKTEIPCPIAMANYTHYVG